MLTEEKNMSNKVAKKPEIIVFAGPNGSGKSTVTRMAKIIEPYINADDIKTSIRCDDLTAAKLATSMREKQLNDRKGFTFETVLSTTRNLKLLKKAKQQGFFIIGRVIIFKIKACYLGNGKTKTFRKFSECLF
jgi:predicted ABC-type ATPase